MISFNFRIFFVNFYDCGLVPIDCRSRVKSRQISDFSRIRSMVNVSRRTQKRHLWHRLSLLRNRIARAFVFAKPRIYKRGKEQKTHPRPRRLDENGDHLGDVSSGVNAHRNDDDEGHTQDLYN